ncbi:MDR/zinc-dependent alcohol dehydrogenase-like family protein [Chloracidobacterium validum]|uniref:MDR/zinc-dependent alcohol dehydrogenase-like family protein n=1 Tax=Chloracidobacterium validum TaxID=2821543 RepID=UPI001FE838FB|nr:alcohol dehydrogenase catalytic domain-containing protein [Chloracidobacterium validum]
MAILASLVWMCPLGEVFGVRALRLTDGVLQVADVPCPSAADEALVRVEYAGICATDAAILNGYANFSGTLGHEFVGVVETAPDAGWVGRRVVADINVGCGACCACAAGNARHCPRRTVLGIRDRDGAFAEFVTVPAANLYAVPESISPLAAVFTEPLAAACRILEQVAIPPGSLIGVLGDGKLGQLIAQVLRAHGLSVRLVGRHAGKLRIAEKLGLQVQTADALKTATHRFDVVVEATGRADGFADALRLVRPQGTVVLKTTGREAWPLPSAAVVVPEVTLIGSRCGNMAAALQLLAEQKVNPLVLIEAVYDLADGLRAVEHARRPGALKVLLRMASAAVSED